MGKQITPPASQTPPAGDHANAVAAGTMTAAGPGAPFSAYGWFNFMIWGSLATPLTTTASSLAASVVTGTGMAAGMTVNSVNVPPGTTWATFSGTAGTLALPPGYTSAQIVTGTDASAAFASVAVTATVQLERTFDGGSTWLICGVGGAGAQAIYANPSSISITNNEVERGVSYRLNCTAYTSGTINYRMSASGLGNTSFGPTG